jgi:putative peptide zinc metalloprotease protein
LFLTDKLFVLGMFFAMLTAFTWFVLPLGKGLSYLFTSPRIRRVRGRALAVSTGAIAIIIVALCFTPVPFRTRAEGVVWIPDEAIVRAGADGFVGQVVGIPGSKVSRGEVLVVCHDSVLTTQVTVLEAQLREIEARIREQIPENIAKAKMLEEEKHYIEEKLARSREQVQDLVITAKVDGTLVLPRAEDLPGRFVHRGDVLAHVVDLNTLTVRTIVDQSDIDLIRHSTKAVQVRLAERLASPIDAGVTRLVPAASDELPSPALGNEGGGQVPMDPKDPKGQKAMRKVFQVDLQLPVELGLVNVGGRVYVRFDHGWEPLMAQWYRQGRQLFLSRFNV